MTTGVLATVAPTPYLFLVCHFQLSAVSIAAGYGLVRELPTLVHRLRLVATALVVSSLAFVVAWLLYDPPWYLFSDWGYPSLVREPIVKLSYGPVLGLLSPILLARLQSRGRSQYGLLLVVSGAMVATMMILNDVFW